MRRSERDHIITFGEARRVTTLPPSERGFPLYIALFFASLLLAGSINAGDTRNWGGYPPQKNAPTAGAGKGSGLGDCYLLLVNTAIARQLKNADLTEFDKSPYGGLAIAFHYNYDTAPVFSAEMMTSQLIEWRKLTKKDLWPWVYFNRMVGASEAANNPRTDVPYFHKIKGIDLEDATGAKSDFLQIWRNSLDSAKALGTPGIVVDLEFYNNYKAYDPSELSRVTGKSPDELVEQLKQLGSQLADTAAERYPGAVLWMLFTGFSHKDFKFIANKSYYPAPVYISMGILDEIQKRHFNLKVISGGEGSLGYCHETLATLREAIQKRAASFSSVLQQYPGILELAGTLTLWNDRAGKSGFIAEGDCARASASTIEELRPYIELLMRTYRYNWIYGSSNGNYFAFNPRSTPRFNAVIAGARADAAGKKPN